MSSISPVIPGPPIGSPGGDSEAMGSIGTSNWRQAFEQARQVEYGDWFGSGGPTVSALPKPKVAPETANEMLSASFRQSLRPDDGSSPLSAGNTTAPQLASAAHSGKARSDEPVERVGARHATPVATDRSPHELASQADGVTSSPGAGATALNVATPAQTTNSAARGNSSQSPQPAVSTAARTPSHDSKGARPPIVAAATVADTATPAPASMLPLPSGPTATDTSFAVAGTLPLAVSAAASQMANPSTLSLQSTNPLPLPSAALFRAPRSPVSFASDAALGEQDALGQTLEARPASRSATAPANADEDTPRVHVESTEGGLRIWLGVDIDASLPGQLEALLAGLRPLLAAHGQPLAELLCNGRSVWRAPARADHVPAARRVQSADVVPLIAEPTPQETL